jgi:hypothetical protein
VPVLQQPGWAAGFLDAILEVHQPWEVLVLLAGSSVAVVRGSEVGLEPAPAGAVAGPFHTTLPLIVVGDKEPFPQRLLIESQNCVQKA